MAKSAKMVANLIYCHPLFNPRWWGLSLKEMKFLEGIRFQLFAGDKSLYNRDVITLLLIARSSYWEIIGI